MSKIKVNSLEGVGASTPAISIDNASGTCTANITNNLSNRNLIINGEMMISQRNGTSNTTIASGATYGVDRFSARSQTGSGHTMAQSTDTPVGFKNSVKITIGTGGTPSSGNRNYFYQAIEGNNIGHLEAGTANAKTLTLSFFVKSSLTGNFGAAITNGNVDYSYTFPYTINSANTWEKKTKTITLTSLGTWATDNTTGLYVFWDLGSGSDYEGTANQWNNAFDIRSSSDVKLVATSSATLFITGVQLEVGSVATDFEHRSFAQELALCLRYYFRIGYGTQYCGVASGLMANTTQIRPHIRWPAAMRSAPTINQSGLSVDNETAAAPSITGISNQYSDNFCGRLNINCNTASFGSGTQAQIYTSNTTSYLEGSSEL